MVAIVALLVSILLPALATAKQRARATACVSHQRQIGIGLTGYVLSNKDRYPKHSSPSSMVPRHRWPDYLHRYMKNTQVYTCTSLSERQEKDFRQPFAHTVDASTGKPLPGTKYHGGYGYNFQYLGNARTKTGPTALPEWAEPYHATLREIRMSASTVAVADTMGSRKGNPARQPGEGSSAVYVVEPPLGSRDLGSRGSRAGADPDVGNMWYEGGTDPADEELYRSRPDARHLDRVSVLFCDGHAEAVAPKILDGRTHGASGDNRYFNGRFDSARR